MTRRRAPHAARDDVRETAEIYASNDRVNDRDRRRRRRRGRPFPDGRGGGGGNDNE